MTIQREPIDRFFSIIPAGGIGSRLWPLSRASAPKFLHDLTGSGQTLLQDTWDRLTPLAGRDRILVVTGKVHKSAVLEQIEDLSTDNLVLELSPKDSTAAIALAAAMRPAAASPPGHFEVPMGDIEPHLERIHASYFEHAPGEDCSRALFEAGVCLPSGSNLSDADLDRVLDLMRGFLAREGGAP
jgi:hypothetical protein